MEHTADDHKDKFDLNRRHHDLLNIEYAMQKGDTQVLICIC